MAALDITDVPVDTGVADVAGAAVAAAGGGDTAPTGPGRFLYVANGGASPVTVTVATPGESSGHAIEDASLVVAAGDVGILPLTRVYASPTTGRASITYSGVTTVTVACFELGT